MLINVNFHNKIAYFSNTVIRFVVKRLFIIFKKNDNLNITNTFQIKFFCLRFNNTDKSRSLKPVKVVGA